MQLPQYKKSNRSSKKLKICKECGVEYWGHVISKYCEVHMDPKNRKRARRRVYVDVNNQVFNHSFREVTEVIFHCDLETCKKPFKIRVFPKQFVYPKYCEEHRNDFKRNDCIRKNRKKDDP